MSEINVNTIDKATGSTLNVGAAGTTVNIAGTAGTGFPASGAALTGSTNNTVVTVTGANAIQGEADLTFDGTNLDLPDNKKIRLGTGNDLEVYHDANNSYLKNNINSLISLSAGHYWRNVADTSNSGMCIVSSNVGIGEETPLGKLHVKTGDSGGTAHVGSDELVVEGSGDSGMTILSATNGDATIRFGDSGNNQIGRVAYNHSSNYLNFWTNNSEKMRILSGGQFLVGTTAMKADGFCSISFPGASTRGMTLFDYEADSTANFMQFNSNGTECGRVQKNGTNSVSFTTSSDYRLKENVDYDFDATTKLKELKPARFNWIADETNTLVDGFIAHEVSNVIPEAITGTKDAMHPEVLYTADDELPEGKNIGDVKEAIKINPQGIDQSKLVPLLTKALQEAITKIETLETKVTALENA